VARATVLEDPQEVLNLRRLEPPPPTAAAAELGAAVAAGAAGPHLHALAGEACGSAGCQRRRGQAFEGDRLGDGPAFCAAAKGVRPAEASTPVSLRVQVDGGSNCNLLGDAVAIARTCISTGPHASGVVGGISGGLPYEGVAVSTSSLGGTLLSPPGGSRQSSLLGSVARHT
jgi:hypothetical protein